MTVGPASLDREGVVGSHDGLAAQHASESCDDGIREVGEVGERALLDASALAVGLAEQDGGGRVAVGHPLDVHGYSIYHEFYDIATLSTSYTWLLKTGGTHPIPLSWHGLPTINPLNVGGTSG
jgi:hypothetical protein